MHSVISSISFFLGRFARQDSGVAAVEAAMLFPVLLIILCGSFDIGVALLINQKLITSAQTVADLLAREDEVSDNELNEAIAAGRLALMPYPTAGFGVDVAGIEFTGASATPGVAWRDTVDMEPNDDVLEAANGLGSRDEGVLAVTVRYTHSPYFSNVFTGDFNMEEVAYARSRRGLFITRAEE